MVPIVVDGSKSALEHETGLEPDDGVAREANGGGTGQADGMGAGQAHEPFDESSVQSTFVVLESRLWEACNVRPKGRIEWRGAVAFMDPGLKVGTAAST